ncbi:hypothetical protein J1614_002513 [Plenodomus biglobosus]|nr:hypothetical protein J1614_002513 [Plenodomus biglobosus]
MPAFLKRLRRRFSGRFERTSPYSTPPLQRGTGKARADEDDRYSIDTIYTKASSGHSSREALPIITDRGSPGYNRYVNEDIFWNSTMVEADHDPVRPPWSSVSQGQKPGFYDIKATVDMGTEYSGPEPREAIREEIHKDPSRGPPVRRHTELPPGGLKEGVVSRHKTRRSRTDNDLIVMMAGSLNSEPVLPVPRRRFRPSAPTARDDYLTEYLEHAYDPPAQRPYAPAHTSAGQSTAADTVIQHDETLTWNSVLNQILANDAVDPIMKERVHERVEASPLTNGIGHGEHAVTAQAAGLVPKFSHPIQGSAFYSRTDVEPPMRSYDVHESHNIGEYIKEPTSNLPNGVPYSNSSTPSAGSSNTLYRPPSPAPSLPADLKTLLTTNLTPSELRLYSRLVGLPCRSPSPPWPLPPPSPSTIAPTTSPTPLHARLTHTLHTLLLNLQDRTTYLEEDLIPRLGQHLEANTAEITTLRDTLGFQDEQIRELKYCVDYASGVLRGCWVREWEVWRTLSQIRRRRLARAGALRRCFSRRLRRQVGGLVVEEERDVQRGMPDWYSGGVEGRGASVFAGWDEGDRAVERRGLAEKELDALMLMAKQNVEILKVDMEEVGYMMREFLRGVGKAKERGAGPRDEKEEMNGKWRDV